MRAKKSLGQHFLTNTRLLDRIADALGDVRGRPVLEIGPGHGALTRALLARGANLVAIERDRDLVPLLHERFPGLRLVEDDALEVNWAEVAGARAPGDYLVAGNIPYNITSPLIDQALRPPRPERIVFLVQKEVADRVASPPGTGNYGALSVGVQAVARAERLFTVAAGAFSPPPRVDSAVLRLTPLEHPLVTDAEVAPFRRLVTGLFSFRRKQLQRGLRELTGWDAATGAAVLASAGLVPSVRPEELSPAAFVALLHALVDVGWAPR